MGLIKEIFPLQQGHTIAGFGASQTLHLEAGMTDRTLRVQVIERIEEKTLELPDLEGEILLYGNDALGTFIVGSSLGGHVYAMDIHTFEITCEVSLKRDPCVGERTFELYTTPSGQRVVVVSELVIVVLTWDGGVLMAHPLTSTVSFEAIEDGAIRLYDRSLEAEVAYKIPQ